jgi:diacylglycerol O-acyltransferase
VTRAVARYVRLHGEATKERFLRVVCPVSVRKEDSGDVLGNRISFLPLALPMAAVGPVEHLKAIALRTAIMKSARTAELVGIAASWLGAAPPPAQALFWWGIPLVPMPAPILNLICTNVPGSPVALYAVGKRMLASYPHVPTGYELGVGIAVQSYNGRMCFGLTADAAVVADVARLRDFIKASWLELCRAAGVRHAAGKKARPAAKRRSAAAVKPETVAGAAPEAPAAPGKEAEPPLVRAQTA